MKDKSRTEYAILNALTGIGGFVLNTIIGFVCRIFFARLLSETYLGVNGLFSNILTMLSLAELGMGTAVIFALYEPLAKKDEEKIASLIDFYRKVYIIIGTVVAFIGLALLPFLKTIIGNTPDIKENIYLIYLLYLLNAVFSYFFCYRSAILQAAQKNYWIIGINYAITILQSFFQIFFLALTKEYIIYLILQILGGMTYNVIISWVAKKEYPYIAQKNIKPLDKNSKIEIAINVKDLMINRVANLFLSSTDNIIATRFSGLSAVGFMSNYVLLSNTLNSLINQLFNGLTASIGNFNVTENKERKYNLFKALNLANFWTYGWGSIGIFVCCSDLVELCFGKKFVMDYNVVFAIALNFYIVGMLNAVWSFKSAMGLFRYGKYILIFTGIINILASIYLGDRYGVFGILIATSIARLLTNAWYEPYALFKYGLKQNPTLYLLRYLKFLVVVVCTGWISFTCCKLFSGCLFVVIVLKMIVCSIICNTVFWMIYGRTTEFEVLYTKGKEVIKKILRKN